MSSSQALPIPLSAKQQRRNLIAHIADGGLYIGATMFVAPATVLPVLFEKLSAPTWLIALAPQLMILGFLLPSLFVAHFVDRMSYVKPFTVWLGLFQRLPYLVIAASFFILDPQQDAPLLLLFVVVGVFGSGIIGGLAMGSWQELLHRTVPAKNRAGMFAARNALAAILGLIVGLLVERILEHFDGMQGYGVLFTCTSVVVFMSYATFWFIKEEPEPDRAQQERIGLWKNIRDAPSVVRSQPGFLLFIVVAVLGTVHALVLPFMAIDACATVDAGDAFVGRLLAAQMFGGLMGNLCAGYMGNRWGGRLPLFIGHALLPLSFVLLVLSSSEWSFLLCFSLLGLAQFTMMVGQNTLALELAPAKRRATGLSVLRTLIAPMLILMSLSAAWMRDSGLDLSVHVYVVLVCAVVILCLITRIPEPRT